MYLLLYPKGAEAGSNCRPSGCLVGVGSVRTLKNNFKSTCSKLSFNL